MAIIAREQYLRPARRLLRHIATLGSANPNIWRRVDEVRAAGSRGSDSWPSWCFLPGGAITTLAREFPAIAPRISRFEALAAWRPSQGMYIFDPVLADELCRTAADEPIPGDVLLRMPEWCIYITLAEGALAKWGLHGVFAFLSYHEKKRGASLRFLFDMDDDDLLATFPIGLNDGSVQDSIKRAAAEAGRTLAAAGKSEELDELSRIDVGRYGRILAPLVNLVLYVCSADADIVDSDSRQNAPSRPTLAKTRKGPRMFPPDEVALWEVGFRVGNAIRRGREEMDKMPAERGEVRPHLRRAHWHAFWTGSRSAPGSRVLRLKWLSPILVNAGEGGNLPAVRIIRPTRKPDESPDACG